MKIKISVGDIIAFFMAAVALAGLFYQARSTALSEQQFNTQLEDISKIVEKLEKQNKELLDEQIDRLNQGRDLYDSQSEMHRQLLDISRSDRKINEMYIASLTMSQTAIYNALQSIDLFCENKVFIEPCT